MITKPDDIEDEAFAHHIAERNVPAAVNDRIWRRRNRIMNPRLAPRSLQGRARADPTPAAFETAMAMGTMMFAAAVFDAVSDSQPQRP